MQLGCVETTYMGESKKYTVASHVPVMVDEVIKYLSPKDGGVYVDGTFGAGGHTKALLEAADCHIYAIDRDPYVELFLSQVPANQADRVTFIPGRFSDMENLLNAQGVSKVDGILLDVGVSSMQIDTPRRGFSFTHDGPLDMRMGNEGGDVAELINRASEEELAGIIFKYGDERMSRRIARAIALARSEKPVVRTVQLAEIVKKAVGRYNDTIHPATRTFQALRIWVNDELRELEEALHAAENLLTPGGTLAVITFHSGEDAIVKDFLKNRSGKIADVSRHQPVLRNNTSAPTFSLLNKKAIKPSDEEIQNNPRARSAKIRVAKRTDALVLTHRGVIQ